MGVRIRGKTGTSVCMRPVRKGLIYGPRDCKGVAKNGIGWKAPPERGTVTFKCWRCILVKKGTAYSLTKVGTEKKGENKISNRRIQIPPKGFI